MRTSTENRSIVEPTHLRPILEVDGVSMKFKGLQVLNGISLAVARNSIHGIIGPNGAGKSTLFNLLSGIYKPTQGTIRINSKNIASRRADELVDLGVGRSFQNSSLFPTMTVRENLLVGTHRLTCSGTFSCMFRTRKTRSEEIKTEEFARNIASFIGLEAVYGTAVSSLPYGIAKLVDIGRALCTRPELLLLDEPAAGLNSMEKRTVSTLIKRIRSEFGISTIVIEHDMALIMKVCEMISVISFGELIATDTPENIQKNDDVIKAYLGTSHPEGQKMPA